MSDVVISAEGLGKKYVIGHQSAERERYTALRDVIARQVRGLGRSAMDILHGRPNIAGDEVEEFWALKDIDFEIRRGDVVGIIGRNGAGKSTLLKVLSRITEPTEGRVEIKGRVASLLEVGTGFHPELTGRENIYLNGAILGMTRAEIKRKFDEIVDFADVEKFLDTPVKRYSSGMYVRLAFSVAAYLEPEILVVDEVLAVGDSEFQKKCLGKMKDVAGDGRTVLFVSHNMNAVRALCRKGILLRRGSIVIGGSIDKAIAGYSKLDHSVKRFKRLTRSSAELSIEHAEASYFPRISGDRAFIALCLNIRAQRSMTASIDIRVKDGLGGVVGFASLGALDPKKLVPFEAGDNTVDLILYADHFASGHYLISIDLTEPYIRHIDRVEDCIGLLIEPAALNGELRTMHQSWGYGSLQLMMERKTIDGGGC